MNTNWVISSPNYRVNRSRAERIAPSGNNIVAAKNRNFSAEAAGAGCGSSHRALSSLISKRGGLRVCDEDSDHRGVSGHTCIVDVRSR